MSRRSATLAMAVTLLVVIASGGVLRPAAAAYQQGPTNAWVPNGTVYAMARAGSTIYLGGDFTSFTNPATGATVGRARLAAVDATSGAPTAWNPGANASVRALAVGSSGVVYAGGAFTRAAGVAASRLSAIASSGRPVSGWTAAADGTVRDILADGTGLYVGGGFTTVNGSARGRLAKLSPSTGAVVTAFNARVAGGAVYSLARSGTSLLVGGAFSSIGGASRTFSGAVATATGAVTTWAPAAQCDSCSVLDMVTDASNVYQAIGGGGGRVAAFSLSSGRRVWVRSADGDVQAVALYNGVVHAGGHFTTFDGAVKHQLVTLSSSSGAVQPYTVSFTGSDAPGIWAVIADAAALRIGGGFRLAGSSTARYASFPTA